jgi:hypothetical protein
MTDLVRELELLAAEVEWPATPRLRTRAAEQRKRAPRRRLALAIALVALLLATAALAATGVIHFGSATIHRVERLPPVDPAPGLALGNPISMHEARALVPLTLPPRLRKPDAAYQQEDGVSLLYLGPHGPRAVLRVFRYTGLVDKLVHQTTEIRRVRVQGAPGLFIAGVHVVDFLYGSDPRLSEPTLLWTRNGLTYRLESRDALKLAG